MVNITMGNSKCITHTKEKSIYFELTYLKELLKRSAPAHLFEKFHNQLKLKHQKPEATENKSPLHR